MYSEKFFFTLINLKSELESKLIDIGLHSKGISEYLNYTNSSHWFHIAWSMKDLEYDGINYDSSYEMCRPAYEYERAKQILYKKLVSEITLFTNLYNGLENYINELDLEECAFRKGKINSATNLIANVLEDYNFNIELYSEILSVSILMYNSIFNEKFSASYKTNECINSFGLGLKLIYKIRNKLMHGKFFFPEPLDYSEIPPFHPELINFSSRLILISLQMLIIAREKVNKNQIHSLMNSTFMLKQKNPSMYCNEKDECKSGCLGCINFSFNKLSFLTNLHLINPNFNSLQLNFNFAK